MGLPMNVQSAAHKVIVASAGIVVAVLLGVAAGPLVGGIVGVIISTALATLWPDPAEKAAERRATEAERRAAALEREVAGFDTPARLVKDAERLTRMRRYGRISGSGGEDR